MVNYILMNALMITIMVMLCVLVAGLLFGFARRIYKNIKFKRECEKERLDYIKEHINQIGETMWEHEYSNRDRFKEMHDRLTLIEEKLNKKETKKNVKKKKRN